MRPGARLTCGFLIATSPLAAQPILVSPAGPGEPLSASSCPTFSWGAPPAGEALELLVFAVPSVGVAPSAEPAIRQALPPGTTAWTPPADRCLSAGRYAWIVMPRGTAMTSAEPAVFRVGEDSRLRVRALEQALARLGATPSDAGLSPARPIVDDALEEALSWAPETVRATPSSDLRWLAGAAFSPPACGAPDIFNDVDSSNPLCPWIEQAYSDGISQGCGGGNYCPKNPVTREQLAVFLGKVHHADAGGDLTGTFPSPTLANSLRLPQGCAGNATAIWNGSTWNCGAPNSVPIPFHVQANGGHWGEIAGPGIGGTGDTGVTGWGTTGVFGYGNGTGVWGETGVASGVGVRGNAWAGGLGVYGYSGGSNYGVYGESASASGVYGFTSAVAGVNAGVFGKSTSRQGVRGESTSDIGVAGFSTSYLGVYGFSEPGSGVLGRSNSWSGANPQVNAGVHGIGSGGPAGLYVDKGASGVWGESYDGIGLLGVSNYMTGLYAASLDDVYAAAQIENLGGGLALFVGSGGCNGCMPSVAGPSSNQSAHVARLRRSTRASLIETSAGAHLTKGGAWVNSSDSARKTNFASVDGSDLLQRLKKLPIQSWSYIADGSAMRHIGPTAQDFQATFQLGGDETTISTIDPAGIALAAIQELARRTEELSTALSEMQALRSEVRQLRARLDLRSE